MSVELQHILKEIIKTFCLALCHHQQNKCYPQRCLLAHNNKSQICYFGQISLQSAAVITTVFLTIWHLWSNIYFAGDGLYRLYRKLDSLRKFLQPDEELMYKPFMLHIYIYIYIYIYIAPYIRVYLPGYI